MYLQQGYSERAKAHVWFLCFLPLYYDIRGLTVWLKSPTDIDHSQQLDTIKGCSAILGRIF